MENIYTWDKLNGLPVDPEAVSYTHLNIVYGSTKNGIVFALDARTGKLLWKHKKGDSLINTVVRCV